MEDFKGWRQEESETRGIEQSAKRKSVERQRGALRNSGRREGHAVGKGRGRRVAEERFLKNTHPLLEGGEEEGWARSAAHGVAPQRGDADDGMSQHAHKLAAPQDGLVVGRREHVR